MRGSIGTDAPVEQWSRRLAGVGAAATALALAVAAGTGVVLVWRYRPDLGEVTALQAGESKGRGPVRWHQGALIAAVAASVWWTCMCALRAAAWRSGRSFVSVLAALATLLLALGASLTWYLVEWDQLALWAVTTGEDVSGLWVAGFSDEVRFVLVGGTEVGQSTYSRWLLVHLAAPFVALATSAIGWWGNRAHEDAPGAGSSGPH